MNSDDLLGSAWEHWWQLDHAGPVRRLAYSTGSTSTQPAGHAGWGDADFSLVGHNHGELKAQVLAEGGEDGNPPSDFY